MGAVYGAACHAPPLSRWEELDREFVTASISATYRRLIIVETSRAILSAACGRIT